ncbi:hypothetical protein [Nannocystis pusilla]|uniref:hypothetical protein n=1 Tax=Nannocystis pusilla TaxID=889268 RepID=UPI003B76CA09
MKYPHTTAYLAEIAKVEPATILEWRTIGLFQGIATTKQGGDRKGVRRLGRLKPRTVSARSCG